MKDERDYFIFKISESNLKLNDENIISIVKQMNNKNYFIGCFQNLNCFKTITPILKNEFSLKTPLSKNNEKLKKNILETRNSVFLHIRRGDYLTNNNYCFVKLGAGYYNGALRIIKERLDNPHIFVFSNDIEFCKNNLIKSLDSNIIKNMEFSFIEGNDEGNASEEMELMKMCQNAIIANSTFSWWAAYLMDNKNKIVITPSAFFYDDTNPKVKHILPKDWIVIDYIWGMEIKL
ncbi:alpha-1,2-fucosyltransferase [Helicobacter sp. MIT 14-3879]|nr:alpha-1,2-fucosyltransferase [Helicobacter sp. MIT 14-3879]